ncbi:MAG: protein-disulfide reductase DsbD family protein, partial [Crocinitomicaceae bacterium]
MKHVFSILLILFVNTFLFAQGRPWQENVKWSFKVKKVQGSQTEAYIVGTATLAEGYHIFSVSHDPSKADMTGSPTKFKFKKSNFYKVVGSLQDVGKAHIFKDEYGTQLYFEKKASFKQKIEVLTDKQFDISFSYEFQICNADGCQFPPTQDKKLTLSGFKPEKPILEEVLEPQDATNESSSTNASNKGGERISIEQAEQEKGSSLMIFIAGFLAGLIALFTPCMFPMIPMTVTFFTKQSKTRREGIMKALIYGASIIIIYVTFGLIFTAATGPIGLNDLSTNIWMNLIFFAVFMLFAFSFLGAFEIQLPNSWVNKMDKQADRGGLIGIFFMAFTLGLVSFSCTGPIIGSLLVEAATSGSYFTPAIGMTGFSLALAIPFTLFAIFPGWLNSVKVCLGLLEIAFALKFLSAVDLAYHWGILTREWFIGTWFVI